MPCPESWYKLQPILKFAFISTLISFFVTVIGFSTPVWISGSFELKIYHAVSGEFSGIKKMAHLGLWHACGSDLRCINITKDMPAFFIATRVFACFSLISAFVTTALVFWYVCIAKDNGRLVVFSMISSLITAGLLVITVGIWGGEVKFNLSFSFAMMCIADILYFGNGLMFALYILSGRR